MAERVPIITLLTDFGTDDTYAGQMKGAVLARCPTARIVDLTHAVRPQAVEQGAFLLESALDAFPSGTVHIAVVDPGVGTERLCLAIRADHGGSERFFIGPDNGLLSCALPLGRRPPVEERPRLGPGEPVRVAVPDSIRARSIEPGNAIVSAVFHGRDIFAVAAARLACGLPFERLGPPVGEMLALPPFRGVVSGGQRVAGRIVHIDRFGNAVSTVHVSQLGALPRWVEAGGVRITRIVHTYGDGKGVVALYGSSGYLEIAAVNGSAATELNVALGDPVLVEPGEPLTPLL